MTNPLPTHTRAEAFRELIRVLEAVPPSRFDLGTFGFPGTIACAAGWAMLDPWFNERGFIKVGEGSWVVPIYGDDSSAKAISKFFQISGHVTAQLFYRSGWVHLDGNPTLAQFIAKVRLLGLDLDMPSANDAEPEPAAQPQPVA